MKNIFNGNVKDSDAIISLAFFSILMSVIAIFFLATALFYDNCESSARVALFFLASISFAFAIIYPVAAIYFVRRMDRYPRISRMFFKDYLYVDNKNI